MGENDPEFDTRTYLNEMWKEDFAESVAMVEVRDSLGISDADLAEDLETQFKLIAAAYTTGEADEIDRVINHIAFFRHMKKQELHEAGDANDKDLGE
ncbi:hypothetical protein [Ruegeria conchae]|nr:hypothetical protein [Ruegeria conchae]